MIILRTPANLPGARTGMVRAGRFMNIRGGNSRFVMVTSIRVSPGSGRVILRRMRPTGSSS